MQRATAVSLVDAVQGLHQAGAAGVCLVVLGVSDVQVQAQLFGVGALQVHQHHAGFGVLVAGLVEVAHDGAGDFAQVGGVAAGSRQQDGAVGAVLPVFLAEGAGADEGHELAGLAVLFAQLFSGAAGEFGNGFDQLMQLSHGLAEGSRTRNLLFVGRDVVDRQAGGAVEFSDGLGQDDGPAALHGDRVRSGQVEGGADAHLVQLGRQSAAHAPDVANFGGGQQFLVCGTVQFRPLADLGEFGGVAAGFALRTFGDVVGQLGQGLGRGDADAGRDADPAVDACADLAGAQGQVAGDALQVDKAFVNGVDLLPVAEAGGQAHHAVAHVAVELEVGREGDEAGLLFQVADLEEGRAHLDAQGLGFVAAGNRAAVVVGQDHDRAAVQAWLEDALATRIEVVAVEKRDHVLAVMVKRCAGGSWPRPRPRSPPSGRPWGRCRGRPGFRV